MEQTVNGYTRVLDSRAAFDRRSEDPSKDFGIHGVEMRFVVRKDGLAVQFLLYTNWMLPQNRRGGNCGSFCLNAPLPADLGYHSLVARYKGQELSQTKCEHLEGKPCYYGGSSLAADSIFDTLTAKGFDGVWAALEEYHADMLTEAPPMTAHDDALEAVRRGAQLSVSGRLLESAIGCDLQAALPVLASEHAALVEELTHRRWFMEAEGYRRCDIPACNCPYWHGGNAGERLREVGDAMEGLTQGVTITDAIAALRAEHAALEAERDATDAHLQAALVAEESQRDTIAALRSERDALRDALVEINTLARRSVESRIDGHRIDMTYIEQWATVALQPRDQGETT